MRRIFIVTAAVVCAGLCSLGIVRGVKATTQNKTEWLALTLEDEYDYGTEYTLPTRTLNASGEMYTVNGTLEFPDGTVTRKAKTVLDVAGVYTLKHTASVNGKVYLKEESFTVQTPICYYDPSVSSVEYGVHPQANGKEGLMIRLGRGDMLTFNSLIDVSRLTSDDVFVDFFITPLYIGQVNFSYMKLILTDSMDPSVYLQIKINQSPDGPDLHAVYIQAGGNDQNMSGYESFPKIMWQDGGVWGTAYYHNFAGLFSPSEYSIKLCYDAEEVALYGAKNYWGKAIISDFNDAKYVFNYWNGFPSGKARLSIICDDYVQDTADFVVTSVLGTDLTQKTVLDDQAPVITVEKEYKEMPNAVYEQGGAYSYPVPVASAYDAFDGETDVDVTVWYNYGGGNTVMLDIVDGKFKTEHPGRYAIRYRSMDKQGNLSEKLLYVNAVAPTDIEPLSVNVSEQDRIVGAMLGEELSFAAATVTGGSGEKRVDVSVTFEGETQEVVGSYRPERAGTYTVTYTATDYIGQKSTVDYTFAARAGEKPVFVDEFSFPSVLISGGKYVFPEYYVNDYSSGVLVRRRATGLLKDKNGERELEAGDTFIPEATVNGDITTVKFVCGEAEEMLEVPTILQYDENGELRMERYLNGDGIEVTANDDTLTVRATAADGKWTFANTVLAETFSLSLEADPEKDDFDALLFTLSDTENVTDRLTFKIQKRTVNSSVEIGGRSYDVLAGFSKGSNSYEFLISYSNGNLKINDIGIGVKEILTDGTFKGFSSGVITFSVAFEGAGEQAAYSVSRVNNQALNNIIYDNGNPVVAVSSAMFDNVKIGDIVTLPKAICGDVLDRNVEFTLTVTNREYETVTDISGKLLSKVDPYTEYTIRLTDFGQYHVTYYVSDSYGNETRTSGSYTINVPDNEAPEIFFEGKIPLKVKVGETIVMPKIFVVEENVVFRVYLKSATGVIYTLYNGNDLKYDSFVCSYIGTYEFRIIAVDESGNINLQQIYIEVTE